MGRTTLRRMLVKAGLDSPRSRRPPKHRVRRQRMSQEGMLIQLDGSYHRWLGEDGPQFTILFAVDDATGCVVNALFCEQEDRLNYFLLMEGLVRSHGVPLALYADRHPVFKHRSEYQPAGTPTQFGRTMEELGIQLIFALSPQAKGRVERTAGTFQYRLVTELRLSGAATMEEAKAVLKQFLPRYNRRFRVPPQCPDSAFRPMGPELRLQQIMCFKYRRRVARDNTVKFRRHTLQLLPSRLRPTYAGATVTVLEGLDGRLSLQHEGRIIASQDAPSRPEELRDGKASPAIASVPPPGAGCPASPLAAVTEALRQIPDESQECDLDAMEEAPEKMTISIPAGRPTFLQRERWKAVQEAKRKGLSIRGMARELGIHRDTVRRYIDAESPPMRRTPAILSDPESDTIPE